MVMKIGDLIKRLQEIEEYQGSELEVFSYYQNTQRARDFDDVSIVKSGDTFNVWLSDLGEE
ncbi:hypothetical protein D3C78_1872530 [compost metagenome]